MGNLFTLRRGKSARTAKAWRGVRPSAALETDRQAVRSLGQILRPKLLLGSPEDAREREAEAAADRAMRAPGEEGESAEAEERVLRDEIGDPTLRYLRSEEQPAGTWRVIYRSSEGYRIIKLFRNFAREIVPAETYAVSRDGRSMTVAELIAERRARVAPPAAP